jgi:hypothetical protein
VCDKTKRFCSANSLRKWRPAQVEKMRDGCELGGVAEWRARSARQRGGPSVRPFAALVLVARVALVEQMQLAKAACARIRPEQLKHCRAGRTVGPPRTDAGIWLSVISLVR